MNCASNVGCLCLAMIPQQNRKGVLVLVNSSVAWARVGFGQWAVGRRQWDVGPWAVGRGTWTRGRWARGWWAVGRGPVGDGQWAVGQAIPIR